MTAVQSGDNRFIAALSKHLGGFGIHSLISGTRLQIKLICIFVHFLFFLLHVLLLLAWRYNWFGKITFDLGQASTTASTIISVSSQVVATLFTVVMVLTTQRISIRSQAESYITLTATHDINTAWSGLGSAALGLFHQFDVSTHPILVATVGLYLLGISIVHTTSPSVINVQTFSPQETVQILTRGIVDYGNQELLSSGESLLEEELVPGMFGTDSTPAIYRMNSSSNPGLYANIVYNIPDDNDATEPMDVSALSFNVSCHPKSGLSAEFWEDGSAIFDGTASGFTLLDLYGLGTSLKFGSPQDQLWVFSAIAIRDGNGSLAGETPFPSNQTFRPYNASSIQIIGCDMDLEVGSLKVNPQSKTPVEHAVFQGTGKIYTLDEGSAPASGPWWQQILSNWAYGGIFASEPVGDEVHKLECHDPTHSAFPSLRRPCPLPDATQAVEYILDSSNAPSWIFIDEAALGAPQPSIPIAAIEASISNLVAGGIWGDLNFNMNNISLALYRQYQLNQTISGTKIYPPRSRLGVSFSTLLVGTVTSFILLVIASSLTLPSSSWRWGKHRDAGNYGIHSVLHPEIDSIGILQTMWITQKREDLRNIMRGVDVPTLRHLRRAGMIDLCLAQGWDMNEKRDPYEELLLRERSKTPV